MKTIFTLITMAIMTISANAKEEIAVSGFTPWDNCTIDGSTINMGEGWKGGSIHIGKDMTQYDYVWIKFTNATGTPNFGVTYDEWQKKESWGDVFVSTTAPMSGTGIVGIKLDKKTVMVKGNAETNGTGIGDVYAQHVQQLTIQGGSGVASVTVEGIWFGTTEEYAADGGDVVVRPSAGGSATIFDTETVFDGWGVSPTIGKDKFEIAEAGDVIYCSVKDITAEYNPLFKYQDYSDFTELMAAGVFNKDDNHFETTIDAAALTYLQSNGLRFQGVGFTLTKVELKVPATAGIKNIKANTNKTNLLYNLAGQQVDENYKGVVIKNGKKQLNK